MRPEVSAFAEEMKQEHGPGPAPFEGKSLTDFAEMELDGSKTILGKRYLCVGGAMLFVGPSGIGKSTASVQQDVLWSVGKPAFGINPSRPLKSLCIQAENDDGDMTEFAKSVIDGLELLTEERELVRKNTSYISHRNFTGREFIEFAERCVAQFRPDILRIDPLQAYLGDDPKETRALTNFTRSSLNPLLERYSCGLILNHHTPKTNHRDTSKWKPSDWMYAGAGAADLTNWARAVIIIDPCEGDPRLFRLIAAKRGGRIGWFDLNGQAVTERYFRHSRKDGVILWEDADLEEVAEAKKGKESRGGKSKDDVLALVPQADPIEKNALISKAQSKGIGRNSAREFIAELEHDRKLFLHLTKRKGTNPLKSLARYPQSEGAE